MATPSRLETKRQVIDKTSEVRILYSGSEEYGYSEFSETQTYGYYIPIVSIGESYTSLQPADILRFTLDVTGALPSLSITVSSSDRAFLSAGTLLRVVLLPWNETDETVRLTFSLTSYNVVSSGHTNINARLWTRPELYMTEYRSHGTVSSYELMNDISMYAGLGFRSNCSELKDRKNVFTNVPTDRIIQTKKCGTPETPVMVKVDEYCELCYADVSALLKTKSWEDFTIKSWPNILVTNASLPREENTFSATFTSLPAYSTSPMYIKSYKTLDSHGKATSAVIISRVVDEFGNVNVVGSTAIRAAGDQTGEETLIAKPTGVNVDVSDELLGVSHDILAARLRTSSITVTACPVYGIRLFDLVKVEMYNSDIVSAAATESSDKGEVLADGSRVYPSQRNGWYIVTGKIYKYEQGGALECEYVLCKTDIGE